MDLSAGHSVFFFRAFSIILTMLPNPLHQCHTTIGSSSAWLEGLYILVFIRKTCADVLYSGHTVNLTLIGLLFHDYSHVASLTSLDPLAPLCCGVPLLSKQGELLRCTTAKVIVWVMVCVGYLIIIATHFHYSVDVYLGSTLTVFVWRWYHSYIRTLHRRKFVLHKMFMFLETEAPDVKLVQERSVIQEAAWVNQRGAQSDLDQKSPVGAVKP